MHDAIKPDLTMFLHYETLEEDGKKVVAVSIQRGTERPYYIATGRGLCSSGVFFCSGNRFGNSSDDKRNRWRPF